MTFVGNSFVAITKCTSTASAVAAVAIHFFVLVRVAILKYHCILVLS